MAAIGHEVRKDVTPSERVSIERAPNAEIERQRGKEAPARFCGKFKRSARLVSSATASPHIKPATIFVASPGFEYGMTAEGNCANT